MTDELEKIRPALDELVACCNEAGISLDSGTAKPGRKPAPAAATQPGKTDQAAQDR